ncbi:S8/S53 family peptidase [Streptomyces sp. NPDC056660]|uniref:S8/S53 family peptidase n=1 Tax=Streptomyces sp. NPDC056660 TaxID=3345897 RepID=UPI0036B69698
MTPTAIRKRPRPAQRPAPRAPEPPRRSAAQEAPDAPAADFSVFAGRLPTLQRALDLWPRLIEGPPLRLRSAPVLMPFPQGMEAESAHAVRIAVVRHAPEDAVELVRRVRAAMQRWDVTGVVFEPGYFFTPVSFDPPTAGRRAGGGQWTIQWHRDHQADLFARQPVVLPSAALGARWVSGWNSTRRIALIDTGDESADDQMAFQRNAFPGKEKPVDHNGHGTAMGSLIRAVAPHVTLRSYRVFEPGTIRAESVNALCALNVAVNSREVQVICLPQRAEVSIDDMVVEGALRMVLHQHQEQGQYTPVVVCAAGNQAPDHLMSVPATLPGVVVCRGLDRQGLPAPYNCLPPAEVQPHYLDALGGLQEDPLGTLCRSGHKAAALYGSSCATAKIAATLAAGRGH